MSAWLAQHGRSLAATLARFARTPLGSTFNILVMGVALSLPVGFYVLIDNLQASSRQLTIDPQISAFMALNASSAEVAQIETRLRQNPRVQRFRFVSRDQALQEVKQSSGLADVASRVCRKIRRPMPSSSTPGTVRQRGSKRCAKRSSNGRASRTCSSTRHGRSGWTRRCGSAAWWSRFSVDCSRSRWLLSHSTRCVCKC